ncbi:MAG: hypothetical protein JW963_18055 [Anaerolineales bacterium]|nr:hypothetical protein [Anaerolineales bacterium]
MPLRAAIDGEQVVAPLLSDDEWFELRQAVRAGKKSVVMPCCNGPGHLRMSKLGLKHFAHNRGSQRTDGCDRHETQEHLLAKAEIAIACKAASYDPITEASGPDWRADILATKGNIKIAFEVQWSSQTLDETLARQQRYKEAGIRCCWLFRKPPPQLQDANRDLPLFPVRQDENGNFLVSLLPPAFWKYPSIVPPKEMLLQEFIAALLQGRIKFRERLVTRQELQVRVVFVDMPCWKCGAEAHIYYVSKGFVASCGLPVPADQGNLWNDSKLIFHPLIVKAVQTFLKTQAGRHVKLGAIKPRFSKTVGTQYMSFGCPQCDVIFGDFFVMEAVLEAAYHEDQAPAILETTLTFPETFSNPTPHWCHAPGGDFCEG